MWTVIINTAVKIIAGIGLADLFDRFIRPQVPAPYQPAPIAPGWQPIKLVWLVAVFVAAFMLLKFVGRKMKIKMLT